jgi:hypothetical protein
LETNSLESSWAPGNLEPTMAYPARIARVADSDFRFFPTMRDEIFDYVLHPVDFAMNKISG